VVVFYVNYNLRTCGTSQGVNASSSLVAPTIQGGEIKKSMLFFIEPTQVGMFFEKAKNIPFFKKRPLGGRFLC